MIAVTQKTQPAEVQELESKRKELAELEAETAVLELDLSSLRSVMHEFEVKYIRFVGFHKAELHDIEAQILEAEALRDLNNPVLREKALGARTRAIESARKTRIAYSENQKSTTSTQRIQSLYREIAKQVHPDLKNNPSERKHCQRIMSEANSAYNDRDEAKLRAIQVQWESRDALHEEEVAMELIHVIRKIARIKEYKHRIVREIACIEESDLNKLRIEVDTRENEGHDLLAEMSEKINSQLNIAYMRLNRITEARKLVANQ